MKAFLISIHPQWVELILNGIKKDEIRKGTAIGKAINKLIEEQGVAPMLIYCTKGKEKLITFDKYLGSEIVCGYDCTSNKKHIKYGANDVLNGKVVARFNATAEEIKQRIGVFWAWGGHPYYTDNVGEENLLNRSCLSAKELENYLQGKSGTAIHINDLKIFDKPKEISEFYGTFTQKRYEHIFGNNAVELDEEYGGLRQPTKSGYEYVYPLTRAPQSWCYVEVLL